MAYKVFLSYTDDDVTLARKIYSKLKRKRGVMPYMDEMDPAPGGFLWNRLEGKIKTSNCVIVLWTSKGAKSQYVNQEVGAAKSFGKKIIPIVQEKKSIVGAIDGLEWIPYNMKAYKKAIKRVLQLKREKEIAEKNRAKNLSLMQNISIAVLLILLAYLLLT